MVTMLSIQCCIFVLLLSLVDSKRAIVTLLSGPSANAERYVRLLHTFVYSLRNAGYAGEIAVMHTESFPIRHDRLASVLGVTLIPVEQITIPNHKSNLQYATMLTKLHIWSLTQYDHIMYYDCDFVFQHNPETAFSECFWSSLCATPDTGMSEYNRRIKPGTYFNGGFLVVRPNKNTYNMLMSKKHLAFDRPFVEQDLLNDLFKDKWGKLDSKYNLMHCYKLREIDPQVVAIHEKLWILRKAFIDRRYVWNSPKLRINYAIEDVLERTPPAAVPAKAPAPAQALGSGSAAASAPVSPTAKQERYPAQHKQQHSNGNEKQLPRSTKREMALARAERSRQQQIEILQAAGLLPKPVKQVVTADSKAVVASGGKEGVVGAVVTREAAAGAAVANKRDGTERWSDTSEAGNIDSQSVAPAEAGQPLSEGLSYSLPKQKHQQLQLQRQRERNRANIMRLRQGQHQSTMASQGKRQGRGSSGGGSDGASGGSSGGDGIIHNGAAANTDSPVTRAADAAAVTAASAAEDAPERDTGIAPGAAWKLVPS